MECGFHFDLSESVWFTENGRRQKRIIVDVEQPRSMESRSLLQVTWIRNENINRFVNVSHGKDSQTDALDVIKWLFYSKRQLDVFLLRIFSLYVHSIEDE